MELWELTARERIRDAIAQYNWSGDGLRLDELAAVFCEDGELEVRGDNPLRGRRAIAEFISGVGDRVATDASARPIVRHNVTNIRFLEVTRDRALAESYYTVFTAIGLDHYGRYRDTFVPVGDAWLIRHRLVSLDWRAEDSAMAPR
jgi:hypothetical protein